MGRENKWQLTDGERSVLPGGLTSTGAELDRKLQDSDLGYQVMVTSMRSAVRRDARCSRMLKKAQLLRMDGGLHGEARELGGPDRA